MDKKISVSQIKEAAQEAYEMFKTNTDLADLHHEYF